MKYFKNPLWEVVGIILITGIILSLYSFSSQKISFGKINIEKAGVKQFFQSENTNTLKIKLPSCFRQKEKAKLDTSKQRILFIGDSMLEGLMYKAKEYTEFNGHELFPVIWYSSSTLWYGESDTISYFIKKYNPTYIFLVLGANELFINNIFEKRNKFVKRILTQIDTIPFIWIGPPNWKDDTGINDMIMANVDKNQYFESKKLSYKRAKDGAHPVRSSANMWMDSIASWVMNDSKQPILLKKPTEIKHPNPHPTLLQPMY